MQNITSKNSDENAYLDLSVLARRAGIPYPTSVSAGLARFYGLSRQSLWDERYDLYDLMWAVASSLTGCLETRSQISREQETYWINFHSIIEGTADAQEICVVATLVNRASGRGTLHLSLADEARKPARRVLVVEDDGQVASLVCRLLQRSEFSALSVALGKEVPPIARKFHPDLILLDVDLPDLCGFEVCIQLKQDPELSGIPVVFFSGRHCIKEHVLALGAVDCLEKPRDLSQLVERISQWISGASGKR